MSLVRAFWEESGWKPASGGFMVSPSEPWTISHEYCFEIVLDMAASDRQRFPNTSGLRIMDNRTTVQASANAMWIMCVSIASSRAVRATSSGFAAGPVDARALSPAVFSKTCAAKQGVLTARSHRFRRCALNLCDLGQKKQIREERTQMNGSVQVVDQRRADGGLRQDQLDGGERIARVALEHREKCVIFFRRIELLLFHCGGTAIAQTRDGFRGTAEILANLSAGSASLVVGKPLRRISQHEFVAFFDRVATF